MLTGYNQDVHVGEDVIHVQTEDKGREKAVVETLVYRGGTIIAAKRTSYAEQLAGGQLSDDVLGETIRKQHQIVVAIIKAGKVEEFVRAAQRATERGRMPADGLPDSRPEVIPGGASLPVAPAALGPAEVAAALAPGPAHSQPAQSAAPVPPALAVSGIAAASVDAEESSAAELGDVADAVLSRISRPPTGELDLDQIVSDYLQSGRQKERLRLRMLGRSDFLAGDTIVLQVQATRGTGQPIEGASVVVKVIGTAFRPQIFPGHTDHEGIASFNLTLPTFTAGSAAIVVQASSKLGDGEIKHLIRRR